MTAAVADRAEVMGSETPRIFTPPLRELTPETSLGFSFIRFCENVLFMPLFPWQKWLAIHMLELRENGTFRYKEVHLTIARQNGKTHFMKLFILWRMFVNMPGSMVLGAAQSRKEALATWADVRSTALDAEVLAARMHRGSSQTGVEAMKLQNRSSYLVVTLKKDAGRGKTAGTLFLDELREHKSWDAWNSLESTTLVPVNAMVVSASNAGDQSSVVMREKRRVAHDQIFRGETAETRMAWFEYSAPDGCALDDVEAWAAANPSLGHSLTVESIQAARSKTDNAFRTENLCQWVDTLEPGIIPEDAWIRDMDRGSRRVGGERVSVGLDVSWDRSKASISLVFDRSDGRRHGEVVAYRAGTAWVAQWLQSRLTLTDRQARDLGLPSGQLGREWFTGEVAVQARGCPASSLIPELEAAGITVVEVGGGDLSASAGNLYDRIVGDPVSETVAEDLRARGLEVPLPTLRFAHRGQPVLDEAVRNTLAKTAGDAWLLDRRGSRSDASPLVALSLADWLHDRPVEEAPRSAYDSGATFEML